MRARDILHARTSSNTREYSRARVIHERARAIHERARVLLALACSSHLCNLRPHALAQVQQLVLPQEFIK